MAAPMTAPAGVPQWELELLASPEYVARQAALSVLTRKAVIDQSDRSTAWLVPYALLGEILTAAIDAVQPILERTAQERADRKHAECCTWVGSTTSGPTEAVYDMAYQAFKNAPYGSSIVRAIVDFVWPLAATAGRHRAAANIRARADAVPLIPIRRGPQLIANLRPDVTVEWAARIAEGADGG